MIPLQELLHDIEHLTPIPVSQPRLAQALADPHADLSAIVRVIEYDPALTANALKLANSAYYSPGVAIHSVQEAVMRLGAGRILRYAVGRQLRTPLVQAYPEYGLEEQELWRHSVAAAVAADLLPHFAKVAVHPVAFTAALLHDLGKLVLARHLTAEAKANIAGTMRTQRVPYVEAERAVLGYDHAQVGGVIARRWHFPEELASAIAHHHCPRHDSGEDYVLDTVHVSNAVAKIIGIGLGDEEMNLLADSVSARALGLVPATLESLCAAAAQELPAVLALFEEEEYGVQHSYRG